MATAARSPAARGGSRRLACAMAWTLVAVGLAAADEPRPGAAATLDRKMFSKPPFNYFHLKLTLDNPTAEPAWFVIPHSGFRRLQANPIEFAPARDGIPDIESRRYAGRGGAAVLVHVTGTAKFAETFDAVLLPPLGRVVFEDYEVWTTGDTLEKLEITAAKALLVNATTPLQSWLPYPTMSALDVVVPRTDRFDALSDVGDTGQKRTDYPRDAIRAVTLRGVTALTVPVR